MKCTLAQIHIYTHTPYRPCSFDFFWFGSWFQKQNFQITTIKSPVERASHPASVSYTHTTQQNTNKASAQPQLNHFARSFVYYNCDYIFISHSLFGLYKELIDCNLWFQVWKKRYEINFQRQREWECREVKAIAERTFKGKLSKIFNSIGSKFQFNDRWFMRMNVVSIGNEKLQRIW